MFPVVILSGGLGTRIKSKTKNHPKALLDIEGKPFIVRQLEYLSSQNIKKVIICAGYLGDQIQKVIGNGDVYNINVEYSFDGEVLLGTGGSIKKALNKVDENFFILYGDSYLPICFKRVQEFFLKKNTSALMTIYKNESKFDKSNVYFKNKTIIYNKDNPTAEMKYIDYGLNLVNKKIFKKFMNNDIFDLSEVFTYLSENSMLDVMEIYDRFYEVGSEEGLINTIDYFKKK
ncbi:sugar phosphate nucleotidyltransferase [Candidatus Pelagibacter bacterium]|nr:sugar phosphate nucleotidyltransferase [Candidatus Pelagibacter bacterium]MDA9624934.1 sugar phosphate nucleotidyltransferase [Candidatus Pelagibacter bacterium]